MPVFLAVGNHDGEEVRRRGADDPDGLAVWSCSLRKRLFPNPEPDTFFTGNSQPHPYAGILQDYFAWQWGDALFIVLDPYWHTPAVPKGAAAETLWTRTLGKEQYDWLARTLLESKARYKFVFIHQLIGGSGKDGRGGAEVAPYFEWGGMNSDGTDGFALHRPGWPEPIHALLVRHHVTAIFHGHDHLYAHQQLGGIVYQAVPQPATPGETPPKQAGEYGYTQGTLLGSPGYLRVTVRPESVKIEYIQSDGGKTVDSYIVK